MAGSLTIDNINGKVISSSPVATESQVIGVGQTWQDVTASRAAGTTYTNSTGKPILVCVSFGASAGCTIQVTINGTINFYGSSINAANYNTFASFIVPNNSTYRVQNNNGASNVSTWAELR